jgi:hypothetical protein
MLADIAAEWPATDATARYAALRDEDRRQGGREQLLDGGANEVFQIP